MAKPISPSDIEPEWFIYIGREPVRHLVTPVLYTYGLEGMRRHEYRSTRMYTSEILEWIKTKQRWAGTIVQTSVPVSAFDVWA